MLKSIAGGARSAYTCLFIGRSELGQKSGPLLDAISQKCLHTTPAISALGKDTKSKKVTIKMSQEFKLDQASEGTKADKFSGSDQRIAVIPDLNTNSMLINGIRFDELPILHLKCSPNNTIALLTDSTGRKHYGRTSCGQEGFRNAKKSSTVAAQAAGMSIGYMAKKNGLEFIRVAIKGIGAGRMPALKGVDMAGIKIVSITDRTPIFSNGPRPRKARRL